MTLVVDRLTPAIGAEIRGLSTNKSSSFAFGSELSEQLYQALLDNHVVVFRDLELAPLALARFGEMFGALGARHHRYTTHAECDDVVVLEWGGERKPDAAEWHADMTYRSTPPFASVLQAIVVPPTGGDTLWASMFAVHDALDAGLRRDLESLDAVHDMGAFRTPAYEEGGNEGMAEAFAQAGTAAHPIIAHHPVHGRPYLNVSESFTRFIIGMSAPESGRLLTHLFDLINRPDFHVRVRWQPNTIAVWDNRGSQHYAVADYLPHRRVMHRVAVAADSRAA